MEFTAENYIMKHAEVFSELNTSDIEVAIDCVLTAIADGKKVITCGNGGSASTASHYITDWNKMYTLATGKKLRGICLTDNAGLITAYANDVAYDEIFAGQLESLFDGGDLLVCVSGSGNSPNVLRAAETAKKLGGKVLAVVGYDGGKLLPLADAAFHVPSFDMQICEDIHLSFGHMVMKTICKSSIN